MQKQRFLPRSLRTGVMVNICSILKLCIEFTGIFPQKIVAVFFLVLSIQQSNIVQFIAF